MGVTLGFMGAGGSILTMPILVYFLNVPPVIATGYSLLIVGVTALVGAIRYYRKDQINIRIALMFAVPAIIAVYTTRRFMVPAIPIEIIFYENIIKFKFDISFSKSNPQKQFFLKKRVITEVEA